MHDFSPFVFETLGVWGLEAASLVLELYRRIAVITGEPRSASFLRQRIDVEFQRGNAASSWSWYSSNTSSLTSMQSSWPGWTGCT